MCIQYLLAKTSSLGFIPDEITSVMGNVNQEHVRFKTMF